MATEQVTPILTKVTYHAKDSIVFDNGRVVFVDSETYKTSLSGYIDSLDFLDEKKYKSYFRTVNPIWTIEFIDVIENNTRIDDYSNSIENLFESISDYGGDCGINKIIKDVEEYFDKHYSKKHGKETMKFITLFYEWSYCDSYTGDGDYGIEYKGISDIYNIQENIKIINERDQYLYWT